MSQVYATQCPNHEDGVQCPHNSLVFKWVFIIAKYLQQKNGVNFQKKSFRRFREKHALKKIIQKYPMIQAILFPAFFFKKFKLLYSNGKSVMKIRWIVTGVTVISYRCDISICFVFSTKSKSPGCIYSVRSERKRLVYTEYCPEPSRKKIEERTWSFYSSIQVFALFESNQNNLTPGSIYSNMFGLSMHTISMEWPHFHTFKH